MAQGSLIPKNRFLGQKVCSVARVQTDRQTDTKVNTEDTLSGFQEFFLQPIIKDRSNNENPSQKLILLSDNMFDYIVWLLVWAVDGGKGWGAKVSLHITLLWASF